MSLLVSPGFRIDLINHYPAFCDRPDLISLFGHLIFPILRDKATGDPLVSRELVARLVGKESELRGHRFKSGPILNELRSVLGSEVLTISPYSYVERYCRKTELTLPEPIAELLKAEFNGTQGDGVVELATGAAYRRPRRKDVRLVDVCSFINEDQALILNTLRQLPPNSFHAVRTRVAAARKFVNHNFTEKKLSHQLGVLRQIELEPMPEYAISETRTTARVFGASAGLPYASSMVRQILCEGWYEVDITNCQLAIVAHLWDLPDIADFLQRHGSVWPSVLDHLGIDPCEPGCGLVKKGCKELLYSAIFGMSKGNLMKSATKLLGGLLDNPKRIFDHWIFKTLLKQRQKMITKLMQERSASTVYGQCLTIEYMEDARRALAQQAQAFELKLIAEVYRFAQGKEKDMRILLHQHDGVSMKFARRPGQYMRQIDAAFQAAASRHGIEAQLEWKLCGGVN